MQCRNAFSFLFPFFVGINAQFIKQGQIVLRTLALVEVTSNQTGEYLKKLILNAISQYGISASNIYTITTDNGANMLSAVSQIIGEQEQATADPYDFNQTIDDVISGITYEDTLLEILEDNEFTVDNSVVTTGVRCVAHTLQLVIEDAIRSTGSKVHDVIDRARTVVKHLRTPHVMYLIRAKYLDAPILDNETRWHSKLDMLMRLRELKPFCIELERDDSKLKLSDEDWIAVESICEALTPAKKATKKMRTDQLTAGEPFIEIFSLHNFK